MQTRFLAILGEEPKRMSLIRQAVRRSFRETLQFLRSGPSGSRLRLPQVDGNDQEIVIEMRVDFANRHPNHSNVFNNLKFIKFMVFKLWLRNQADQVGRRVKPRIVGRPISFMMRMSFRLISERVSLFFDRHFAYGDRTMRILLPIDGSEVSDEAVRCVRWLAGPATGKPSCLGMLGRK